MRKTGAKHLTTHAKAKAGTKAALRKGQRFTVHGATHVRRMKARKPGAVQNLPQP